MHRVFATVFVAALVFLDFASGGTLERRAPCSCPSFDLGYYPVTPGTSGTVGSTLRCFYPAISRCQYSSSSGVLQRDTNYGLCRTSSSPTVCPSTDLAGYPLGPGSGVYAGVLYCTYPTTTELNSLTYFCDYSSSGALSADDDAGLCPSSASCSDSTAAPPPPPPVTTTRVTTATTTRMTTDFTTVTPTTTGIISTSSTATAQQAIHSPGRSTTKRTVGIAVGVSIAGIALIAAGLVAYFLRTRNTSQNKRFTIDSADLPPTPVVQPYNQGARVPVDDRWRAGPVPQMHENIHPSPPPQNYGYQTTPSPHPDMNSDGRSWAGQSGYSVPPAHDPNMNAGWQQTTPPPNPGSPFRGAAGYNLRPEL